MSHVKEKRLEENMDIPLYKEELLDHYRHPRNYGELSDAQVRTEVLNPSCGDQISLQLIVDEGGERISKIAFQGKGCVISQAAASMLTEHALRASLKDLQAFSKDDMLSLLGITLGPTRLRCALLALESLQSALKNIKQGDPDA